MNDLNEEFGQSDVPEDQTRVTQLKGYFNKMIDRITTYAESLPIEDYFSAKAIQCMMQSVYGRMCSNEQFERICQITCRKPMPKARPPHDDCAKKEEKAKVVEEVINDAEEVKDEKIEDVLQEVTDEKIEDVLQEVTDDAEKNEETINDDFFADLKTVKAWEIWKKLQTEGFVDDHLQPKNLRAWQEVLLADAFAKRIGLTNKWQVFESFWGLAYMKQSYQKAVANIHASDFYKKLTQLGL